MNTLHVIFGDENISRKNKVEALLSETGISKDDAMNFTRYEEKQATARAIIDNAETVPFFSPTNQRVIHVVNSGLFCKGRKEETDALCKWIDTLPDYVCLIFEETKTEKTNKLYKYVSGKGKIVECKQPSPYQLQPIVAKKAEQLGLKMDNATLKYLSSCLPANVEFIYSELEKLASYSNAITIADIDELCVLSSEKSSSDMVCAIAKGDKELPLRIYHEILANKNTFSNDPYKSKKTNAVGILFSLDTEFENILLIKTLLKTKSAKEIQEELGMSSFLFSRAYEVVNSYSIAQLSKILSWSFQTTADIMSGKAKDSDAVEAFVIKCLNIHSISKSA